MKRGGLFRGNIKKKLSLVMFFVLIFNVFALPILASNDVAYIFKNENIVDDNVVGVFEGLGFNVELINEKNIPNDLSNYKFVYLGDERYRNEDEIKIWKYPAIISNYFYGDDWGLTDRDGISKLASNSPLSVKIGNQIIQVYNKAKFNNGIGIPYYYLSEENKVNELEMIAQTYTGNGNDMGDVISYGSAGLELENGEVVEDNICFFGIIESDYWTEDVIGLLEECVEHVSDICTDENCGTITCNNDNDCEDGNDQTTDICLNPGSIDSTCTHENVLCLDNNDCGTNRYTGELFCDGKDILRNFVSYACNSAGTQASFCSNNIDAISVYTCNYACNGGSCLRCNTQNDCDDENENTVDVCIFGGSIDSYCNHNVISCFQDDDCGLDSFVGTPFCIADNVYQDFRDLSCTNAGTSNSFCDTNIEAELIENCEFGCNDGACLL